MFGRGDAKEGGREKWAVGVVAWNRRNFFGGHRVQSRKIRLRYSRKC